MKVVGIALIAGLLAASGTVASLAQQGQQGAMPDMKGMSGMDMSKMSPMQKDSMAAMEKMNKAMMQGMMDPDPDLAWMKGMAAHHQGAVDMSEAAIKNTKDKDVLKEARKTKEENEKSIKELQTKMKAEK